MHNQIQPPTQLAHPAEWLDPTVRMEAGSSLGYPANRLAPLGRGSACKTRATEVLVRPAQHLNKKAQGQFCIISLRVANIGNDAATFSDDDQKLINSHQQQFSTDTEAAIYLDDSELIPGTDQSW